MNINKKLTLKDRIINLISSVPPTPKLSDGKIEDSIRGITIRFKPEVRRFLDHNAESLGCSIQDLVSMTMTSVMKATETPFASDLEIMCSRFRHLFEVYGVNTFDIPDLFENESFSRSTLMDDTRLVDALTPEFISEVCEKFNIESDWLKGGSAYPIPSSGHYRFYKDIGDVAYRLARYSISGLKPRILFVLSMNNDTNIPEIMSRAATDDSSSKELPIGIVIVKQASLSGRIVPIYDVLQPERWNYKKCRIQLKTLMLFCQKSGIQFDGVRLLSTQFSQLFDGKKLPIEILNKPQKIWHPDSLIWNDPNRNPEFQELRDVEDCYSNNTYEASTKYISIHQMACKTPWKLVDRDAYINGEFINEVKAFDCKANTE